MSRSPWATVYALIRVPTPTGLIAGLRLWYSLW